jgi:hypothetical protein
MSEETERTQTEPLNEDDTINDVDCSEDEETSSGVNRRRTRDRGGSTDDEDSNNGDIDDDKDQGYTELIARQHHVGTNVKGNNDKCHDENIQANNGEGGIEEDDEWAEDDEVCSTDINGMCYNICLPDGLIL